MNESDKSGKLRVVSISHSAANRASGRLRYETLVALRQDIDLTVVVPDRWQEYGKPMTIDPPIGPLDLRVQRIRLPYVPRVGWYLHYYPDLGRLLVDEKPDVLHLWEEPWSIVGLQAVRLRNRLLPNTALLLETDQNILRRLPPPFEQIRRYTLTYVDLLIGRQDESLEVSRKCGFTGPTGIVEYGVASDIFYRQDRAASRATLGLSGFVIGYVGRIVREKGLHDVLDAMVACKLPITLVIVGSGVDRDAMMARAAVLGLSEQVRMLDPRPPAEVAKIINALDVLVLMSRTTATWKEQFGRVIMEAHACGVPVIGSNSGSIPGVVANGGWIVPEGDAAALARVLVRLIADPTEIFSVSQTALHQAQQRFSVTTVANALTDCFIRAAAARRTRHSVRQMT